MLNHRIAITVPSNVQGVVNVEAQAAWAKLALIGLTEWFGGATVIDGMGGFKQDGKVVIEAVKIVSSFTDDAGLASHRNDVIAFAHSLRTMMKQDAIAVEIDGRLLIVDSTGPWAKAA